MLLGSGGPNRVWSELALTSDTDTYDAYRRIALQSPMSAHARRMAPIDDSGSSGVPAASQVQSL